MASHFDASPFVLLSGVHQTLIKPLPVGQLCRGLVLLAGVEVLEVGQGEECW